jgi:hypothetical protein
VELLGGNIPIAEEHQSMVRETESGRIEEKAKKNYRNRIQHIHKFLEAKYPSHYNVGVRDLTLEELSDPNNFHHKNKKDLVCTGLNVEFIKAFLASRKEKGNGKIMGMVNTRKYKDAIVWGSKEKKEPLPPSFYDEIDTYLNSFKKVTRNAAKEGKLDEQQADPITMTLHSKFLKWSLLSKNVFVWVHSIMQWNCMARSINIAPLALHNMIVMEDAIRVKYDKTKADQTGDKVRDKHLYSNPHWPLGSVNLALGVWFCLEVERFQRTSLLFNEEKNQDEAASSKYCYQFQELFREHETEVRNHIRWEHSNVHGVRKGSATFATSGTTLPPSISSIANRGEWSLGAVLDVYFHFCEPGDHYLGRVLCGLDANDANFKVLPPHFVMDSDPMENEFVREAMELMFGRMLAKWKNTAVDPTGLLLRCLASIVHHRHWLQKICLEVPGHPFANIPLLNNPTLLQQLADLVTLEPIGQLKIYTGIPPHVETACMCRSILGATKEMLTEMKNMAQTVKTAVSEACEAKAEENGQITGERLQTMLKSHMAEVSEMVNEKLEEIIENMKRIGTTGESGIDMNNEDDNGGDDTNWMAGEEDHNVESSGRKHRVYAHGGRFFHVPENFEFPNAKLHTGWKLWIGGQPGHKVKSQDGTVKDAPIRAFRLLDPKMLPKEARQTFKLKWLPIFKMMEAAPGLNLDEAQDSAEHYDETYQTAMEHLKSQVQYVFQNPNYKVDSWSLGTWSVRVARSSVEKFGTEADKARLRQTPKNRQNNQRRSVVRETEDGREKQRRRKRKAHGRDLSDGRRHNAATAQNGTRRENRAQMNTRSASTNTNTRSASTNTNNNADSNTNNQNKNPFEEAFGRAPQAQATREQLEHATQRVNRMFQNEDIEDQARAQDQINDDFARGITHERPEQGDGVVTHQRAPVMPPERGNVSAFDRRDEVARLAGSSRKTFLDENGNERGPCEIQGIRCGFPTLQLRGNGSHGCAARNCNRRLHNLCVQQAGTLFDGRHGTFHYCSNACMNASARNRT